MSEENHSETAAQKWAHGGMWLLIWLGFGSCVYLSKQKGPIVQITSEAAIKP